MAARITYDIDKFDGKKHFGMWQVEVTDILVKENLIVALDKKPEAMKEEDWNKLDRAACSTIRLCLSREIKHNVMTETSAKNIWEQLEKLYLEKSLTNRINLKKEFYRFSMKEGTSMQDHLNEFSRLLSELLNMEVKMEEEDKVAVLVASLPTKYDHLVTTMLYGKKTIVLDEVKSTLLSEEKRKKTLEGDEKNIAMYVRGGSANQGSQSSRPKWKNYKGKTCYYCHEEGHIIIYCPKLKEKNAKGKGKDKVQTEGSIASLVADSEDDECALIATMYSSKSFNDVWVLDSGCTVHMCPNRDFFSSYKEVKSGSVRMANGEAFQIFGIGTIKIKTREGLMRTLYDVRHVPDLKRNLISVGVLDSEGYKIVTVGGVMEVVMGSRVVMKGTKVGNLYFLQGNIVTGGAIGRSSMVNENSPFVNCKGVTKKKIGNLNSYSGCEGATQHYGGMKSAFRWQPKLQQSLLGGKPTRTGVALSCGNLGDKDVAHTNVIKMRERQEISHDSDAGESQGRPILHEGEKMTFNYQPVVCGRLAEVAKINVKCGDSESASGGIMEFDKDGGGMLVAAQDMHGLKNEIPRIKFKEDLNLIKILHC